MTVSSVYPLNIQSFEDTEIDESWNYILTLVWCSMVAWVCACYFYLNPALLSHSHTLVISQAHLKEQSLAWYCLHTQMLRFSSLIESHAMDIWSTYVTDDDCLLDVSFLLTNLDSLYISISVF